MKILKYSVFALAIAIMLNVMSAFAGRTTITGKVGMMVDIPAGKTISTENWDKRDENSLRRQSYQFQASSTTITAPCPNCKFRVELYNAAGGQFGYVIGKTGDNYYFANGSMYNGEYYLKVKRNDFTAVTSHHTADWYIEAANDKAVIFKG